MSENNTNKPKRNPNFIYWVYGGIALLLIGANYLFNATGATLRDISVFYELADSSYVTDVSVVNRSRVDFKLNEKGQDFVKKQLL
jgi:cell division protease FtsH